MSKTEKRLHQSEYVNNEWYYAQLADDWYIHDWDGEYLVMRRMSENGYGSITARQASLMNYGSIYELDGNQIRILLGKEIPNWDELRKQPLEEYKEWLKNRTD